MDELIEQELGLMAVEQSKPWAIAFEVPADLHDSFWSRVDKAGDCWLWNGSRNREGYGYFLLPDGKRRGAHRISHVIAKGPLRTGQVIDHLCRNPRCVNPAHLEAVSNRENTRRGTAGLHRVRERAAITHCKAGHPLSGDNLKPRKDGARECQICRKAWTKEYDRKRRAAIRSRSLAQHNSQE